MIPHLNLLQYFQPYAVLALYLGTIPIFLLSAFRKPLIGLIYAIPLLPLQNVRFAMHRYPLGRSFVDIILLGVIIGLFVRGQFSIQSKPLGRIALIVSVYTYVSLWIGSLFGDFPLPLWVDDDRVSRWKNHVIIPLVVFICVLAAVRTAKEMKILLLAMCLTITMLNKTQYSNAREHTFEAYDQNQRSEDFGNGLGSNELGALEAQVCMFTLGLYTFEKRRLLRWGYFGLSVLSAYLVMASFSRGAYVALLVGWAFVGTVKARGLGLGLVAFMLTWQTLVPNAVRDRIFMTYNESGELEDSSATRVSLWEDALEAFTQEPVLGKGYDTYRLSGRLGGWHDSHNFYIKVIFETGIVGLVIILSMFWKLYRVGYRLFRTANDPFLASLGLGLAAWMVCAAVANVFGDRWNYVQITGYLWTIAGCVIRGQLITNETNEEAQMDAAELAHV